MCWIWPPHWICGVKDLGFISVSSFSFHCTLSLGSCKKEKFIKYLFNAYEVEKTEGKEAGRNTSANNGYWDLKIEAIWIHCKLLNNAVINYKLPLRSCAHPCCFPLQYAADDICDYKLVLGTCLVWTNGLLLLINSAAWGSIIPLVWRLCQYILKSFSGDQFAEICWAGWL